MSAGPTYPGDYHDDWKSGPPEGLKINEVTLDEVLKAHRRAEGKPDKYPTDYLPDKFMRSNWIPGVSRWREADSGTLVTDLLAPPYEPEDEPDLSTEPAAHVGNPDVVAGEGAAEALQAGYTTEQLSGNGPISDEDAQTLVDDLQSSGGSAPSGSGLVAVVVAVVVAVAYWVIS